MEDGMQSKDSTTDAQTVFSSVSTVFKIQSPLLHFDCFRKLWAMYVTLASRERVRGPYHIYNIIHKKAKYSIVHTQTYLSLLISELTVEVSF
jgi:hypothetical protein